MKTTQWNLVKGENDVNCAMVRSEVVYCAVTGNFEWKNDCENDQRGPCQTVIEHYGKKHVVLFLFGLRIPADRLAFLFMNERWPDGEIRHANGSTSDNRFFNLIDDPKNAKAERVGGGQRGYDNEIDGMVYDRKNKHWIVFDESDCGLPHVICDSVEHASQERRKMREEVIRIQYQKRS